MKADNLFRNVFVKKTPFYTYFEAYKVAQLRVM